MSSCSHPQDALVLFWGRAFHITSHTTSVTAGPHPLLLTPLFTLFHVTNLLLQMKQYLYCEVMGTWLWPPRSEGWRWSRGCLSSGCRLQCYTSSRITCPVKPCVLHWMEEAVTAALYIKFHDTFTRKILKLSWNSKHRKIIVMTMCGNPVMLLRVATRLKFGSFQVCQHVLIRDTMSEHSMPPLH